MIRWVRDGWKGQRRAQDVATKAIMLLSLDVIRWKGQRRAQDVATRSVARSA